MCLSRSLKQSGAVALLACMAVLCHSSGALGASSAAPEGPTGEAVIIHAGKLLQNPVTGIKIKQTIVIHGDRIVAVRAGYPDAAQLGEPATTRVIDLSGQFVMAGMMDLHVHLTLPYSATGPGPKLTSAQMALAGAADALKTLDAGFTTVRDLGGDDEAVMALKWAIQHGDVPGPRLYVAGELISVTGGHADGGFSYGSTMGQIPQNTNLCDGPYECRRVVRRQVSLGADWIKIVTSGGGGDAMGAPDAPAEMDPDEAQALIDTAHSLGRHVAVHAHSTAGINLALEYGADTIEHASFADQRSIELFLKHQACMVPTLTVLDNVRKEYEKGEAPPETMALLKSFLDQSPGDIAKAYKAGVCIALGTDAGIVPHGDNAEELQWLERIGMSPSAALAAATTVPARILGRQRDLGQIQPGYLADIIAVEGNPLKDIEVMRHVVFVMKDGTVYVNMPSP